MISRTTIEAASDIIDDITAASIISIIRMTTAYKENPSYFADIQARIDDINGTIKAKQLNAALDELEALGVGEVQINQSQTTGTDGLIWSQTVEREGLISYVLGIMYEAFSSSVLVEDDTGLTVRGNYAVGRLPLNCGIWL